MVKINESEYEKRKKSNGDYNIDWLDAIVIVDFDLVHGQTIEQIYSINCSLDDLDKSKIQYLSLPDNHNRLRTDVQYIFRYHNDNAPKNTFKYCSSFFRQIKVCLFDF